jgi:hypothetical protein
MEKAAEAPPKEESNIPRDNGQLLTWGIQGAYRGYTGGIQGVKVLVAGWFGVARGVSQVTG